METEFIYWRHRTVPGIKAEEVCGAEDKSGRLWIDMAYQIYGENGKEGFREIGHFRNGAPFIMGETCRISISHTSHFLVVATLPPTPEVNLGEFSERAAMGVDAESITRSQVLKVRDKFLSEEEQCLVDAEDVASNVLAWTCKEALYKAALVEGIDFRNSLRIHSLPVPGPAVPPKEVSADTAALFGSASILLPDGDGVREVEMLLYSYESEGNYVTLAYSPRCAKFG